MAHPVDPPPIQREGWPPGAVAAYLPGLAAAVAELDALELDEVADLFARGRFSARGPVVFIDANGAQIN